MVYCRTCGAQMEDTDHSCAKCGAANPAPAKMVYCRGCGGQMHESASSCPKCGAINQNPVQGVVASSDSALKFIIPIGRSGWAIAAGYLGLFSLIVLPAPLALLCGAMALWDIKKHPEKTGMPRAIFGLVMGVFGTILLIALFVGKR